MARTPGRALPTRDELRIWRDYAETAETLRSRMSTRLQSESALSGADYQVLVALHDTPDRRIRPSDLAASIGWQRSRLSHHLGRMEARGLIRREECADDSRGAEIFVTTAGAEAFRRCTVPHLKDIQELFVAALTPEQLREVEGISRALRAHLGMPTLSPLTIEGSS
jgi:DNA-binding MarR family transcriptional regulator